VVYQASAGEGYTPPASDASWIGVFEWNAAAYFNHHPNLQVASASQNQTLLSWDSQPGWGYQVQWSSDLVNWNVVTNVNNASDFSSQYIYTNAVGNTQMFWRLATQPGGF